MPRYDYDLFTIGAGSGGVRASRIASQFGARVAVAEDYRVGGTCVIRGCVPKKLFVYASHFAEEFEDAEAFGWSVPQPTFDWSTLIANKDKEIDRLNGIYIRNLEKANVEIIADRAIVKDKHTVHLVNEDRDITAKYILIATGGWPYTDRSIQGHEHAISSNEAFHLDSLPKRVMVYGGGYIAVEFAGIFHGLGVQTDLVYRGEEILRGFDDDLRAGVHTEIAKKGIKVRTLTTIKEITKKGDVYNVLLSTGDIVETDLVMFATGRVANTEGLGLEQAGVALDGGGAIKVDDYSQTNVESIYAVGDVTNRVNLTPVAIREGQAFAETVFNDNPIKVDHDMIPSAVFSQPEVGTCGLTEAEARESCDQVDIYKTSFRALKHTLTGRDEKTLMKLVVDGSTDKVLGVHLMGPSSGEMIQLAGVALKMGATKAQFDQTVAVHPTSSEELVTLREKWQG